MYIESILFHSDTAHLLRGLSHGQIRGFQAPEDAFDAVPPHLGSTRGRLRILKATCIDHVRLKDGVNTSEKLHN